MKGKFNNIQRRGLPGGPNELFSYVTGVFSEEGYRSDSPDVNNIYNVIPSGDISMRERNGMPLRKGPIFGIDNYGNGEIMMPGGEYKFPGNRVLEIPLAQDGNGENVKPIIINPFYNAYQPPINLNLPQFQNVGYRPQIDIMGGGTNSQYDIFANVNVPITDRFGVSGNFSNFREGDFRGGSYGIDFNYNIPIRGSKSRTRPSNVKDLPIYQKRGQLTSNDSARYQANKILKYEQLRGGPGGTPLPQYSDPKYMNMLMNDIYPEVKKIMPNATAMEAGEAMDFIFNAGWDKENKKILKDPRAYALQEYYRQYDKSKLDKEGNWPGRKQPVTNELYLSTIGKLPENQRRVLMNKGRDWYYQNTNNPAPGVPNPNYEATWYGRIWNTNDFLPFNPNNPMFTPSKQYGGGLTKYQKKGELLIDPKTKKINLEAFDRLQSQLKEQELIAQSRPEGAKAIPEIQIVGERPGLGSRIKNALRPYIAPKGGFLDQWRQRIVDETGGEDWYKQPNSVFNAFTSIINSPLQAPQYAAVYAATDGKLQTPSEAMNIQNPYGAFAVDAILDPSNLIGASIVGKVGPKVIQPIVKEAVKREIFPSLNSLTDEVAGYAIRNKKNKEAIAKGNQWLQNWIDDPVTQAKIDKDLGWIPKRGNFLNDKYDLGYHQAKKFQANAAEYPLSNQLQEFVSQVFTKQDPDLKNIHQGNFGVTYRHYLNPLERMPGVQFSNLKYPVDKRIKQNWISRDLSHSQPQRTSTTIHEGTHDWASDFLLQESGQYDDIASMIPKKIKKSTDKYIQYLSEPTEIHARIMELRGSLGITPGRSETVTTDMAKDLMNYLKKNPQESPVDPRMFEIIGNNPKNLAYLFNRLWAVPAATAVGTGALQQFKQSEPKETYQYGGASRADTLNLLANTMAVRNYYTGRDYTPDVNYTGRNLVTPSTSMYKNIWEALKADRSGFIATNAAYGIVTPSGQRKLSMSDYYRPIDHNKFYQREDQNFILDTRAPMQLYDKRIEPTGVLGYTNIKPSDPMSSDIIHFYTYDPISITPWDMLSTKQKKQRINKYGVSGTPYESKQDFIEKTSDQEVIRKQKLLKEAGLYKGKIDGDWGTGSEKAWEKYTELNTIPTTTNTTNTTSETQIVPSTPRFNIQGIIADQYVPDAKDQTSREYRYRINTDKGFDVIQGKQAFEEWKQKNAAEYQPYYQKSTSAPIEYNKGRIQEYLETPTLTYAGDGTRRNGGELSYQYGGESVSKTWERVTGTPWSEAKKSGKTDGSYKQNVALLNSLKTNPGQFAPQASEQVEQTPKQTTPNQGGILNIQSANTFVDAFKIAREQLGPNQIFEWNGKKYGTNVKGEKFIPSEETLKTAGLNTSFVKTNLDKQNYEIDNPYLDKSTIKLQPKEYENWDVVKKKNQQINKANNAEKIIEWKNNHPDDKNYVVIDKSKGLLHIYQPGNSKPLFTSAVDVGAGKGDAQTVTKVMDKNGDGKIDEQEAKVAKADFNLGNKSTGAGKYFISNIDKKGYEGLPLLNMMSEDQYAKFKTTGDVSNVATSFHTGFIRDDNARVSNGCIRCNKTTLDNLTKFLENSSEVYILPEDPGNQFVIENDKLNLKVNYKSPYFTYKDNGKVYKKQEDGWYEADKVGTRFKKINELNRVNDLNNGATNAGYNFYEDSYGNLQKGQGVNKGSSLNYVPIKTTISPKFKEEKFTYFDFSDDEEYNDVKAFANSLASNKQKAMKAAKINGDVYNEIAKMAFGIFGTESNFADTHSGIGNFGRAISKAFSPSTSSSPDIYSKYETYGATEPSRSVGFTQIRWSFLNQDELNALKQVGITSNKDFMDPQKSALATVVLLGIRYNQQLTDDQKKDIWKYLPSKWNSRANYADRVKESSKYLTVEQKVSGNNLESSKTTVPLRQSRPSIVADNTSLYRSNYVPPSMFKKQSPKVSPWTGVKKRLGGIIDQQSSFNIYKKYINGEYTGTLEEDMGKKTYDRLNRIYHKDAKDAGMSVPNYIMTNVLTLE